MGIIYQLFMIISHTEFQMIAQINIESALLAFNQVFPLRFILFGEYYHGSLGKH